MEKGDSMERTPPHEEPQCPVPGSVGAVAPSVLPDCPPTPTLLRPRAPAWTLLPLGPPALLLLPLRFPALLLLSLLLLGCQAFRSPSPDQLRERYMDPGSRMVEVAGVELHLRDEGEGPTLILLHGASASLHTWEPWARSLRGDHRVLSLDLPPSGLTGPHPEERYDPEAYLALVNGVLDHAGVDEAILVGNSLGGYIAARYASRHPERVRGLVLISPAGYPQELPWPLRLLTLPVLGRIHSWITPRWMVERGVASAYGDPGRIRPGVVDRYWELLRAPGNRSGMRRLARTMDELRDREPEWVEDIRVPTLVVWGGADTFTPVELAHRWKEDLPQMELVILEGVGHVAMEELPARSLEVVRPFLADLREREGPSPGSGR